jgi:hypothetical protein
MDNNFYNILQTFKKLNEGVMSEIDLELREIVANQDFDALYNLFSANTPAGRYVQEIYNDVSIDNRLHPDDDFERIEELVFDRLEDQFGGVAEAAYPFANPSQKPGDQVRGTEKATKKANGEHPFKGRLVGASESVEQECERVQPTLMDKLRARWEETKKQKGLMEFGANNPGQNNMGGGATSTTNPQDVANQAQTVQQTQNNLNKLKSAGITLPTSTSQAVKTAIKATDTPTAIPDQTDKKVSMGLGQELEKLLTTGDSNQVARVADALKQVKKDM